MLGLDQIGGIWQEIGEWLIILFMFISVAWFYGMVTRTGLSILGLGQKGGPDTSSGCKHKLNRNMITGKYKCSICTEEFD